MILGRRQFRPAWWAVLLTMLGMALCIALGMWQLQRAHFKEGVENRFQDRLAEPYQSLQFADELQDIQYRKLRLQGRYDNARSLLLDNQLHRGKAGYQVLTPLQLVDSDRVDTALYTAPMALFAFAAIGYVIGFIAERTITEAVEVQFHAQLRAHESAQNTPGTGMTPASQSD